MSRCGFCKSAAKKKLKTKPLGAHFMQDPGYSSAAIRFFSTSGRILSSP